MRIKGTVTMVEKIKEKEECEIKGKKKREYCLGMRHYETKHSLLRC